MADATPSSDAKKQQKTDWTSYAILGATTVAAAAFALSGAISATTAGVIIGTGATIALGYALAKKALKTTKEVKASETESEFEKLKKEM